MSKKTTKKSACNYRTITCAFCKGKGKDPFEVPSKLSNCQVCNGRGRAQVIEPVEICPYCKGSGIFFNHRMPCAVCGGRGAVTKIKGEKRCAKCKGDGREQGSDLPCASCYGLGAI
ncbi:hypothetical protein KKG29_01200 [Patescibacteria group bacterium]|nr:hypothetical protein [Patescibacteria group bacterium]MBU3999780.1 hypothetical protein [Patescibacteria group bacterium]MBU4056373.1 hypothetical protein [Patescibacteria group bacterium]MBU4368727.1 hypothetical protein [Patescibacteria group bacterium]